MSERATPARPLPSLETACLALAGVVVGVYAAVAVLVRPAMYSDSGWGFVVWDAMRRGAPFNHGVGPDPANLSTEVTGALTHWTPGQYLVPGLLELALPDRGLAIAATVTICSAAGLIGWYVLFRAFGFSRRTCSVAIAAVAGSRFFGLPFGFYNGGEVLLFGVAPWFALMVWRLRAFAWWSIAALFAGLAALAFVKLSGLLLGVALIMAAPLTDAPLRIERETVRKCVVGGAALALFGMAFYLVWLTRGATPATSGGEIHWARLLTHTAYSLAATVLASLSLSDLASWIFLHPSRPVLSSLLGVWCALAPVAASLLVLMWWRLKDSYADYLRFALIAGAIYMAIMVALYVRGSAVSVEDRHFRPVSLLLLVGLVHTLIELPGRAGKLLLALVVGALSLYGLASATAHALANAKRPLGVLGFRHSIATQTALDFIRTIDVPGPAGGRPLLLVTSPEIALEARYARVIANHADFQSAEELAGLAWRGRVSPTHVLVQTSLVESGKAHVILRSFRDYPMDGWRAIPLGAFTAYTQ